MVGVLPVNINKAITNQQKDNFSWKTQQIITHASTIAGLFHDFGKANKLFQNKINPGTTSESFEPYRHEWISLRLFQVFVRGNSDEQWLDLMANGNFSAIPPCFRDGLDSHDADKHPILSLPKLAQLVSWLIISHHRLPIVPMWKDELNGNPGDINHIEDWLEKSFGAIWNSYGCNDKDQKHRVKGNWSFMDLSLPYYSTTLYIYSQLYVLLCV